VPAKVRRVTCKDCYFNQSNLCALRLDEPCPTFRPMSRGEMIAPRQAQLLPTPTVRYPEPAVA
jgi:hypothetical protein